MTRRPPLTRVIEDRAPKRHREVPGQLTLDDAQRWQCPSCGGSGISRVPGVTEDDLMVPCRTCKGEGSVDYDPADTSEFGF